MTAAAHVDVNAIRVAHPSAPALGAGAPLPIDPGYGRRLRGAARRARGFRRNGSNPP
jgi:hypothetical protein